MLIASYFHRRLRDSSSTVAVFDSRKIIKLTLFAYLLCEIVDLNDQHVFQCRLNGILLANRGIEETSTLK